LLKGGVDPTVNPLVWFRNGGGVLYEMVEKREKKRRGINKKVLAGGIYFCKGRKANQLQAEAEKWIYTGERKEKETIFFKKEQEEGENHS